MSSGDSEGEALVAGERRKKAKTANPLFDPVGSEHVQYATGTKDRFLHEKLIQQVSGALWLPDGLGKEEQIKRIYSTVALIEKIRPQNEIEGMLAVQMAAAHDAALECLRRAMIPDQTSAGRDQNLKHGAKLLGIYTQQMAALDKHRGKGQQKVTVEHVHVESGGQAIVGNVEHGHTPARARRRPSSQANRLEASSSIPEDLNQLSAPKAREPAQLKKDEG